MSRAGTPVRTGAWSGIALSAGQLALMASGLILSLSLGYAGGLATVGALAPAMLIFQLTCGVLQRTLAEATLLATSHADRAADTVTCRRSVTAALVGGVLGAAVAIAATLAVPGNRPVLALVYAAGMPFALALDIGRSADVAAGASRAAVAETAAWLAAQTALMSLFAALHSPLGIVLSWASINAAVFAASTVRTHRRLAVRGLTAWVRGQRGVMGAASLDALLTGLTPVLAMQVTAFFVTAATLGAVRVLQQVFGPLAFVSIAARRVLIYRRRDDVHTTARQDLRDGVMCLALTAAGAVLLGAATVGGRALLPGLAFIPIGAGLVAAGVEKAALGFSFGCSLSKFVRREFDVLLRARYVMLTLSVLLAPALAARWGAVGYLAGTSTALVVYAVAVLARPAPPERPAKGAQRAEDQHSGAGG
jgi:hypothetical protein